jgi:hypothetical protein
VIRRNKPLSRGTPPKRTGKPKAVNKARKAKNHARAYGADERLSWVKAQPCVVCGSVTYTDGEPDNHNHHTKNGGMSRKADAATIVPLCHTDHRLYHDGRMAQYDKDFWARKAKETEGAWKLYRLHHDIDWEPNGEDADEG